MSLDVGNLLSRWEALTPPDGPGPLLLDKSVNPRKFISFPAHDEYYHMLQNVIVELEAKRAGL